MTKRDFTLKVHEQVLSEIRRELTARVSPQIDLALSQLRERLGEVDPEWLQAAIQSYKETTHGH